MAVIYNEQERRITLYTAHTTYQMGISPLGHLLHYYYGKRAEGDFSYLLQYRDRGFSGNPYDSGADRSYSLDTLPQEYSSFGNGDYRSAGFRIQDAQGTSCCDLRFRGLEIRRGKYSLTALPAVFAEQEEAETLEIRLEDLQAGVEVTLLYGVLPEADILTRAVQVKNLKNSRQYICKVDSASLDFQRRDFDLLHFSGRYGAERLFHREPLTEGRKRLDSLRGESSHQHNPFLILAAPESTEDTGDCYALGLVYSGSFHGDVEVDQVGSTRISMGINEEQLLWELEPGEVFTAPEAVLCFAIGFSELSHRLHHMVQRHLVHGRWAHERRPVLLNSWEGCYFDFDGERVLSLAREARALGIELLVMDDGWFGKRMDDTSSLGDWQTNEEKLGMSLQELARGVRREGLKFGIWIEPEMVSENSELYRAHPDYAFRIPGRDPIRSRCQLVLDFSRKEVVDAVLTSIAETLSRVQPDYIKMDMNRSILEAFSAAAGWQNRGMLLHKYVLGVYDFMERLQKQFPEVMIEGCSGGGARFDLGMLYYTPQIWLSDNTDAVERLGIQYGSSFLYPVATMGAHVSAVPNHQTGRVTPLATRAAVAMAGSFGYELDPVKLTHEEKEEIRSQIQAVKECWELTHEGRYFRLSGPAARGVRTEGYTVNGDVPGKEDFTAWEFAAEDGAEALLCFASTGAHCNPPLAGLRLKGLDPEGLYSAEVVLQSAAWVDQQAFDRLLQREFRGSELLEGGIPLPWLPGEYQSAVLRFRKRS